MVQKRGVSIVQLSDFKEFFRKGGISMVQRDLKKTCPFSWVIISGKNPLQTFPSAGNFKIVAHKGLKLCVRVPYP